MHSFSAKCVLLDIEGTTSSISFVHDEMFPFVRSHLLGFLSANFTSEPVQNAVRMIGQEAGFDPVELINAGLSSDYSQLIGLVHSFMDEDRKSTGLKDLQGQIWKSGFHSGELIAHIYEDVVPAIDRWRAHGIDVRIYSSGSIAAQRLFFGHCLAGNILDRFSDHYDTTFGGKKESSSYQRISKHIGLPMGEILFISDVAAELDAAQAAGLKTIASIRPGNAELPPNCPHVSIRSFAEVELQFS